VGASVAQTGPARPAPSTSAGAATIASLAGGQATTLEPGRRAIRGLRWRGGFRMSLVPFVMAGALAATRPEAARPSQGAPETYVLEAPNSLS